jgi:hypothetical protein
MERPDPSPPTSPLVPSRVIVRASGDYLVRRAAEGIRAFGSLRRVVILTAIGVANVQPIATSAVLTWRYAHVDQIPPDHERQPVSLKELATALNIPPEVAREEVGALIELGLCERALGGVLIPSRVIQSPLISRLNDSNLVCFRQMIDELMAINFDFEAVKSRTDTGSTMVLEPNFEASVTGGLPRRVITRATSVFYLSTAVGGSIPFGGDWMAGTVFATIMSMNSQKFSKDPQRAWLYARADTPPPDTLRVPASIAEVADCLGLGEEIVRPLVDRLIAEGRLDPVDGGYLASMGYMQSEASQAAGMNMTRAFYRMIYDLAHLGVRF